jgi:hypothetical protein
VVQSRVNEGQTWYQGILRGMDLWIKGGGDRETIVGILESEHIQRGKKRREGRDFRGAGRGGLTTKFGSLRR